MRKYGLGILFGVLLGAALFAMGPTPSAQAATCESVSGQMCFATSSCGTNGGKTYVSGGTGTCSSDDAPVCCKQQSSNTCSGGSCMTQAECDSKKGTNDSNCAKTECSDSAKPVYCKVSDNGDDSTGGESTIEFSNPLAFDTVDALLTSVLTALQGIIVTISVIFIIIGAVLYILSAGSDKQMEMGKKAIVAAMIGLAIGIAAPAILKEIYTIVGGTGDLPENVQSAPTIAQIALNTLSFLLGVVGVLSVIMIVVGGMMYLLAAGDEDRIDKGKKIVTYSVIGILVALSAMVLVRQIGSFFTS